jgi:hypothetical protein
LNVDSYVPSSDEDEAEEKHLPDTPSKTRISREELNAPSRRSRIEVRINARGSKSTKATEEPKLKPVGGYFPRPKQFMPPVIRDGVAEHAIKPTIAQLEKSIAAEKAVTDKSKAKGQLESKSYWSLPIPQTKQASEAMGAELERRGIRTGRQYGNFWYNMQMATSRAMGSSVPLFTAHKMSLDQFVEESMRKVEEQRERKQRQKLRREAEAKEEAEKVKKLEGVEAIKLWGAGETDEESSSSGSEDGEELIAKMRDNQKKARSHGAGTSLGR